MTYDPKENEKYHSKKLPPEWYSKLENFFVFNARMITLILVLVFFIAVAVFVKDSSDYDFPAWPYDLTSR
jgi:hypothetical protein